MLLKSGVLGSLLAQQVKELAFKPDDLSSIPETHIVEGEN